MTGFSKLTPSFVALQWIGNLLVFVLVSAWLQIPDSHAWQFAFSVLSGVLLVIAFCWLQVFSFSCLRRDVAGGQLWLKIASFAVVAAFWFLVVQWIGSGSEHYWNYAGYWNSKLSPGQRTFLTPNRLISGMNLLITLLIWAVTALMLPVLLAVSMQRPKWDALKQATRPYRKIFYWITVFLFCLIASQLTSLFVSWKPGNGVTGEIASVVARLGVAYTVDIFLWCLMLALTAAWMEKTPTAAAS
jgi:hypothetical protein